MEYTARLRMEFQAPLTYCIHTLYEALYKDAGEQTIMQHDGIHGSFADGIQGSFDILYTHIAVCIHTLPEPP